MKYIIDSENMGLQKERGLPQKIIRNTIFNIIGRLWAILVVLFLTPYIIGHIGIERYGIWAVVGIVTGYFGLLDFGIGTSFIKYISEFYTRRDYEKINQVINTGFAFYSMFALFFIALAFFIINPLLNFFNIPEKLYNEASFVFLLGFILFCISQAINSFTSIQGGLQRMDITNKVSIAISIPLVIGTIYFLERGYGLPGLMINNAIVLLISSIINIAIAFKLLPELEFNPLLFNKDMFKKLFGFGYKIQISRIANLIHFHLDKVLLAHFLNIGLVTFYTVAAQLAFKVREVPSLLVSAIFPAASELQARANKDSLYKLYFRSMKYVFLIALPISLLAILLAKPFIALWLGEGYEKSALTLQVLVIGYFLNVMAVPAFFILSGIGKPQYGMRASILAAVLNLILSILLVIKIGYFGVVIGAAISMVVGAVYLISMAYRIINIPFWKTSLKIFLRPLLACGISATTIYILINQIEQRGIGWGSLSIIGILYVMIFSLFILVTNYFDEFDKSIINKYSPFRIFNTRQTKGL